MAYRCKYFRIEELVSRKVYQAVGNNAWLLFDENLLRVLDRLHDKFGTMYMNNWLWGGNSNYRGLRHPHLDYAGLMAQKIYSNLSMHNFGKAGDPLFKYASAEDVRKHIIARPTQYPEIKGIEKDVAWLHVDTRNSSNLVLFNAN